MQKEWAHKGFFACDFSYRKLKGKAGYEGRKQSACPELGTETSMGYKHTGVIREVTQMRK